MTSSRGASASGASSIGGLAFGTSARGKSALGTLAFGTSGLRGLVVDLTPPVVVAYTRAFLRACGHGGVMYLGQDLRASSPAIAGAVAAAAREMGVRVVDCGALPTPALALAASVAGAGAVMVTGSHIPDDRNGLKFYTPAGEITKADEAAILAELGSIEGAREGDGALDGALDGGLDSGARSALGPTNTPAYTPPDSAPVSAPYAAAYIQRYVTAFGPQALAGLRLGIYQHSSAARDILLELARALGAEALPLGRSAHFIPLDTEAVEDATRAQLAAWGQTHSLDAIWSTDGDGDRPLLADGAGQLVAGDILGALTARALGARILCIPVSCNGMIDQMAGFDRVIRCKIGSPHVIAAMQGVLRADPAASVVGFEANGGFLLGFAADVTAGRADGRGGAAPHNAAHNAPLPALMTRDAALPLIAPLAAARASAAGKTGAIGQSLGDMLAALPARATAADRLPNIPASASAALLAQLMQPAARAAYLTALGERATGEDLTDGLRLHLASTAILHLRASGNAPELRIYTEATTAPQAQDLLARAISQTRAALAAHPPQGGGNPNTHPPQGADPAAQIPSQKGQL